MIGAGELPLFRAAARPQRHGTHRRDRGRRLLCGLSEFEREASTRRKIMPSNKPKKRRNKGPIVLDAPITTDAREYV
jgi:hypothetical protein